MAGIVGERSGEIYVDWWEHCGLVFCRGAGNAEVNFRRVYARHGLIYAFLESQAYAK